MGKIWPIILSGGSGTRLWPLSRSLYPKQLLPLTGEQSLLQQTVARVGDPKRFHAPIIVSNEEHRFIIAEQLRQMDVIPQVILLEPTGRNTAPAIALGALEALAQDPKALILVLPSDHLIQNLDSFAEAIDKAEKAAKTNESLITFGMYAARPETGYGYIEQGAALKGCGGCYHVSRFVEKPDAKTAEDYIAQGDYFWNSGMFLFGAKSYLDALKKYEPAMLKACEQAMAKAQNDGWFRRPDKQAWAQSPAQSIDYAVMEKTDKAVVVPADIGWSDVGSWRALWDVSEKDADQNTCLGDVLTQNVKNSYLRAEGPAIAAVGLENMVVVSTKDAVLVADKDQVQDVKAIVDQLKSKGREEHIAHVVVYRPWGSYQTTDRGDRFQTKRIVVKPGEKLSLQKHHHRAEHWIVVQGTARVTRGDEVITLYENESTYIPLGTVHRLENPGKIPLHIIEVQSGTYLGEDDIVRLEDTYGRS